MLTKRSIYEQKYIIVDLPNGNIVIQYDTYIPPVTSLGKFNTVYYILNSDNGQTIRTNIIPNTNDTFTTEIIIIDNTIYATGFSMPGMRKRVVGLFKVDSEALTATFTEFSYNSSDDSFGGVINGFAQSGNNSFIYCGTNNFYLDSSTKRGTIWVINK